MTIEDVHPLVADYLKRLRREARDLLISDRDELIAEIEAHLRQETARTSSDAEVLNVLRSLGEPSEIVETQRVQAEELPRAGKGRAWAAVILLLFGGFLFVIGWFVGVALLWSNSGWTRRDKWLATLVLPGGLAVAPAAVLAVSTGQSCLSTATGVITCSAGPSTASVVLQVGVAAVAVLAPLAVSLRLVVRYEQPQSAPAVSF